MPREQKTKAERLSELASLLDRGLLSAEEFERAKAEVMAHQRTYPPAEQHRALQNARRPVLESRDSTRTVLFAFALLLGLLFTWRLSVYVPCRLQCQQTYDEEVESCVSFMSRRLKSKYEARKNPPERWTEPQAREYCTINRRSAQACIARSCRFIPG